MRLKRMGNIVLALLILVVAIIPGLINPQKASASIPSSGGGGAVATQIDAGHIFLDLSNDNATYGGKPLDLSAATGMYFDNNALADGADWPLSQPQNGPNPYFWYQGNTSTCTGHSSLVALGPDYKAAGSYTAGLNLWVADPNLNNPGECVNHTESVQVNDLAVGGNINTFKIVHGRVTSYSGFTIAGAASTTLFYEADQNTIYEVGHDPTMQNANNSDKYVFSLNPANNHYEQAADGAENSNCPDYITLQPGVQGIYIKAQYHTAVFGLAQCPNPVPVNYSGTPFDILVLTETPEAYAQGLGYNNGGGNPTATVQDDCPISEWGLRWVICPILTAIDDAVAPIDALLDKFLTFPTENFNAAVDPGKAYYAAWSSFRDIAVSLLVIAALVMVLGQSMGLEMLDAYSIRKILPRLLIATVALTISWPLMAYVVGFFNNLGNWIGDIILYPFQNLYPQAGSLSPVGIIASVTGATVAGVAAIAALGTALAALDVVGFITLILSLLLALFVAFITLTIREMIIIICVVTAPVAIVAYILPTTQKLWKFWYDALLTALLMFPIVAAFLAAGKVLAILFAVQGGATVLLAPVAIIVSYFMLGTAFRMAGGLAGQAHSMVSGFHGGAFKGLSNIRRKKAQDNLHAAQSGNRFKQTNRLAQWANPRMQQASLYHKRGFTLNRATRRSRAADAMSEHRLERGKEALEALQKAHIDKDDTKLKTLDETIGQGAVVSGLGTGEKGVRDGMFKNKYRQVLSDRLSQERIAAGGTAYTQAETEALTMDKLNAHERSGLEGDTQQLMGIKRQFGNGQSLAYASAVAGFATNTRHRDTVIQNPDGTTTTLHDSGGKALRTIINAATNENGEVDDTMANDLQGILKASYTAREFSKASYGTVDATRRRLQNKDLKSGKALEDAGEALIKDAYEGTNTYERHQGVKPYAEEAYADYAIGNIRTKIADVEKATADLSAARSTNVPIGPAPPPPPPAELTKLGITVAQWPDHWREREVRKATEPAQKKLEDSERLLSQAYAAAQNELDAAMASSTMGGRIWSDKLQAAKVKDPLSGTERTVMQGARDRRDGISEVIKQKQPVMYVDQATGQEKQAVDGAGNPVFREVEVRVPVTRPDVAYLQTRREFTAAETSEANVRGALGPPSDRRLKRNIKLVGRENGINLYSFQYIWSKQVYVGVIAQEIIHDHPEAVAIDGYGYYRVYYHKLGLEMLSLEQWRLKQSGKALASRQANTIDL